MSDWFKKAADKTKAALESETAKQLGKGAKAAAQGTVKAAQATAQYTADELQRQRDEKAKRVQEEEDRLRREAEERAEAARKQKERAEAQRIQREKEEAERLERAELVLKREREAAAEQKEQAIREAREREEAARISEIQEIEERWERNRHHLTDKTISDVIADISRRDSELEFKLEQSVCVRHLSTLSEREIRFFSFASLLHLAGIIGNESYVVYLRFLVCDGEKYTQYTIDQVNDYSEYLEATISPELSSIKADLQIAVSAEKPIHDELSKLRQWFPKDHGICATIDRLMGKRSTAFGQVNSGDPSSKFSYDAGPFALSVGEDDEGMVHFTGETSLITLAMPGAGKTQCHVLPNLRTFAGSVIVLDVKGECWDATAKEREAQFGRVLRFAPSGNDSACYNPLKTINNDPENADLWDECRLLAELLIPLDASAEKTWELQGRDLLTLFIADAVLASKDATMADVLDRVSHIPESMVDAEGNEIASTITQNLYGRLTSSDDATLYPKVMQRTAARFKQMQTAERQYQGVLSGISQHLGVWDSPKLERVIGKSDWAPEDFRKEPLSLYICISPEEIERYAGVLRVIIGQHINRLLTPHTVETVEPETVVDEDGRQSLEVPEPHGPTPLLLMLDELPQLGYMPPVHRALYVGRSYGLRLWMICQNEGQLADAYGKDHAKSMINSCGVQMYMNPSSDDAEMLSKRLGEDDIILTGEKHVVATPQELEGPKYRDAILAFAPGENPLKLAKVFDHVSAPQAQ